jgi:transcriptional regulator with XRE-family HTH domain
MNNTEDKKINKIIASKMKLVRKVKGLSLEEVGKILGVSTQQAQKYETGATQVPFSKLFLFASYFNIKPDFFFTEGEDVNF